MDDALKLTTTQEKTFNELRQAIRQLTREYREKLKAVVQNTSEVNPSWKFGTWIQFFACYSQTASVPRCYSPRLAASTAA